MFRKCRLVFRVLWMWRSGSDPVVVTGMLLVSGALVNGPYALITTAVSADLVSPQNCCRSSVDGSAQLWFCPCKFRGPTRA